jgi:hypothetical protein
MCELGWALLRNLEEDSVCAINGTDTHQIPDILHFFDRCEPHPELHRIYQGFVDILRVGKRR